MNPSGSDVVFVFASHSIQTNPYLFVEVGAHLEKKQNYPLIQNGETCKYGFGDVKISANDAYRTKSKI